MKNFQMPKYPLIWEKDNFFIKIFCSIPNLATGILLRADQTKFVIDPGDGILRDLNKELVSSEILEIDSVFISHGHHDHVGGLWSFLTYLSVMNKQTPLNIYFPKGAVEITSIYKAFNEVYSKELSYKINLIEISDPVKFNIGEVEVIPFKVNHREIIPASEETLEVPSLGFKFLYNGKSICYGGDTAYCDALVEMAKDSDLAVIEAGAEEGEESELHMTKEQAYSIGNSAKEYFLVHVPE